MIVQTKRSWDAAFGGDEAWVVVQRRVDGVVRRKVLVERTSK